MKVIPTAGELEAGFRDFADFTLELLRDVSPRNHHLKFAAVNSQIALELFLKFYYSERGEAHKIIKPKGDGLSNDFRDFSQILGLFFSTHNKVYSERGELQALMEARNDIVHKAQSSQWDAELARIVVKTLFFIHATAWKGLGRTLLFTSNGPHPVSRNSVWRHGAESFAAEITARYDESVRICLSCSARAIVAADIMPLGEAEGAEHLICLNCLTALNMEEQADVIECYVCGHNSYFIDPLNEQSAQQYVGKCTECDTCDWVRKCAGCERFYHPEEADEGDLAGRIFCSQECLDFAIEAQQRTGIGRDR